MVVDAGGVMEPLGIGLTVTTELLEVVPLQTPLLIVAVYVPACVAG
jgi:hypothetical protein